MPAKKQKIAILGFNREGQSLLKFLRTSKKFRSAEVTILDRNPELKVPRGLRAIVGPQYLRHFHEFSVVFRSPGIPYMLPEIQRAIKHGTKFSSATQLFFEELRSQKRRPTIVGVTGTKGKGTTSTLVYECLRAAKINVLLAGNIGKSMLDVLAKARKARVVVLELSSFQLQDLTLSPDIAVVLHVTPDHLDVHESLIEYYTAKGKIAAHQDRDALVYYFPGNIPSSEIVRQSLGKKTLVDPDTFTLFCQKDLRIPGKHNFANAVMAATVARALGISDEVIVRTIARFKGLQYRLELSRTIELGGAAEVRFYNDSAGTNPETCAAAVRAFSVPAVLIAGGKDKNLDYGNLKNALVRSSTFEIVLFGENREKIANQLKGVTQPIQVKGGFLPAVQAAYAAAKAKAKELDCPVAVIFSPASASFDMFKDMYDRGAQFDSVVKGLKV
jgi:UDP-N-acetylmuramoylalanine--D-glutamate ligase